MNGKPQSLVIPGAEIPGDHHTCAHGYAVEKADEHEDQTAGGADCSQSIVAQIVAHNPGVKRIIKLLKNISQENRQGEQKHFLPYGALGQGIEVRIHGFHFLFNRCDCNGSVILLSGKKVKRLAIYEQVWYTMPEGK